MLADTKRQRLVAHIVDVAAETLSLEELARDGIPLVLRLIGAGNWLFYRSREDQPIVPVAGVADCLPEYAVRFAREDPLQRFMRRENPPYFAASGCREWSLLLANRPLADFYRHWELSWLFHMRLNGTGHMEPGYVGFVCGRAANHGDFGDAEIASAAAILPALRAAVRRAGRVASMQSAADAVEALFEQEQERAVMAIDMRGKLLWISAAAVRQLPWHLDAGRTLPDPTLSVVRQLAAIARRTEPSLSGPTPFTVEFRGTRGETFEAESYLARTASGEPFVVLDFGGDGIPPSVYELAGRHGLTRTETEVLSDLIQGRSDADIAARRFVAITTVRTHVTRVLRKLGVGSRLQAVTLALGTAPRSRDCQ